MQCRECARVEKRVGQRDLNEFLRSLAAAQQCGSDSFAQSADHRMILGHRDQSAAAANLVQNVSSSSGLIVGT